MTLIENIKLRNLMYVFENREHAGKLLAEKLKKYAGKDTMILAIPAGGVPVGKVIAKKLNCGFDLAITRKVQFPDNPEAGFGAVSFDGEVVINRKLVKQLLFAEDIVNSQIEKAKREVRYRNEKFRGKKPFPNLKGKTAILVDDGLATGYTMLAAIKSVKRLKPKKLVVATPTASLGAVNLIEKGVDELYCLNVRTGFIFAVADAYKEWYDLSDEEVLDYLKE